MDLCPPGMLSVLVAMAEHATIAPGNDVPRWLTIHSIIPSMHKLCKSHLGGYFHPIFSYVDTC